VSASSNVLLEQQNYSNRIRNQATYGVFDSATGVQDNTHSVLITCGYKPKNLLNASIITVHYTDSEKMSSQQYKDID
jgi:hypothetical protein